MAAEFIPYTGIEWSPQPDWGLTPAPPIDASLLAVGSRAGSITFLRYGHSRRHFGSLMWNIS